MVELRIFVTRVVICFVALAAQVCIGFSQQDWSAPYDRTVAADGSSSAGGFLEGQFDTLLGSSGCNVSLTTRRHKTYSSVPSTLQNLPDMPTSTRVISQTQDSLGLSFGYIYTAGERGTLNPSHDSQQLKLDPLDDPTSMIPDGTSFRLYSYDCGSVVNLAAKASFGASLPIVTFSGALNGEYQNQTVARLALVAGGFQAPLSRLLNGTQGEQLYGKLLLWDFYERNPNLIGQPLFYLAHLKGISVYQFGRSGVSADGSASLSAGLTLPFASASGSFKAQITKTINSTYNGYAWAVTLDANHPALDYQPLPTTAQLAPSAAGVTFSTLTVKEAGFTATVSQGLPYISKQSLVGVPRAVCDKNLWKTDPPQITIGGNSAGTLTVSDAEPSTDASGLPACSFSVTFQPNDSLFSGAVANLQLQYQLYFPLPPVAPAGPPSFVVKVPSLPLATSSYPTLYQNGPSNFTNPQPAAGHHLPSWTTNLALVDPDNAVNTTSPPTVGSFAVTCPSGRPLTFNTSAAFVTATAPSVNLTASFDNDDSSTPLGYDSVPEACTMTGTLTLQMRPVDGNPRPPEAKQMPGSIFYVPKPLPAPVLSNVTTFPQNPVAGTPFSFSVNGTGFDQNSVMVQFTGPGCTSPCPVLNTSLTSKGASSLSGTVMLPNAGNFALTVRNGVAGNFATAPSSLVVAVH
jgi:hypothetical protein